jgi:hypothetical protein
MRRFSLYAGCWRGAACGLAGLAGSLAEAKVLEFKVTEAISPIFDGQSFGTVGQYERLKGTITGAVDPKSPLNAGIVDLGLVAVNTDGLVEYSANFMIFRPLDASKGNRKVIYDLNNRGNVLGFGLFNDAAANSNDPKSAADAGNGFLMRSGYTIVLSGWDSVSPKVPGGGPLVLTVPLAKNADGSPIVGPAMEEFIVDDNKTEKGLLTYPAADPDTSKASLLVRTLVDDAPAPVSAEKWQFDEGGTTISLLPAGAKFEAGKLYNLVCQARDPKVTGLGYAAVRDLAEYLRNGPSSPVPQLTKIYATCDSQPCRLTHDFVELGFNETERGGAALDGILNWEGGASGIYLNYRFAQPFRTHRQRINRWFPEFEFPFTYQNTHDAVTGRSGGWLDRCKASNTCPLIIDANSDNEYWAKNGGLVHTDTTGRDLPDIDGVRIYLIAGRPHGDGVPVSGKGYCQAERNPLVGNQAMRALLVALDAWSSNGTQPPASMVPRVADGTLVDPAQSSTGFPKIPGVNYTGRMHAGDLFERGSDAEKGFLTAWPPRLVKSPYPAKVPSTDLDGNTKAGIRLPDIVAPVGTYTGWNNRANPSQDGCDHLGTFVPFAVTKAEREASGDPRLSLEERYADHASYITAVKDAADSLVARRLLLQEDADRYVSKAEASSVRK